MYLFGIQVLLCLLQAVLVRLDEPIVNVGTSYVFPPEEMSCFFTTSELIFEERMTKIAPTAQIQGAARLERIHVHLPNTDVWETKNVWGAFYFISKNDQEKIDELALKQMQLADVVITFQETSSMSCKTLNVGVLPQAFPIPIYTGFPQDVDVRDYLQRLIEIGAPQDYVSWLETLPANADDCPPPAYLASPSCVSPGILPKTTSFDFGPGPVVTPYEIPCEKLCVFVTDELIFQEAMTQVAPSATLIGGAMLEDQFIALGGQTQPDKFVENKGFDNVWGAAYLIDRNNLPNFFKCGEQSYFVADLSTRVEGLKSAECKTFNVGLLPSGFPFRVFRENRLNIQTYLNRLIELQVPENYVQAIENLAKLCGTNCA